MARKTGWALKSLSWILRFIEFCCAAIIVGIYGYFLAALSTRDLYISTYLKAVEGIAGAAVIYTALALLLVCCIGGIKIVSFLGMILDLAFCGAFIYLAYATRGGRNCTGIVNTPIGTGPSTSSVVVVVGNDEDGFARLPSLRTSCKLNTACFAVAIVGAVFFLLSAIVEYMLIKQRKKEKAYGPSPTNNYTAGSTPVKRRFWQRKPKNRDMEFAAVKNPDTLPHHATPVDARTSYATDATAVGNETREPAVSKYGYGGGGYMPPGNGYVAPVGTAVGHGANGVGADGYQTTTTTHVPLEHVSPTVMHEAHQQEYQAYKPHTVQTDANF